MAKQFSPSQIAKYAEYGRRILEEHTKECIRWGTFDADAEGMADLAVECGLMEYVPYDPDVHTEFIGDGEFDQGDMIYYWGKGSREEKADG